MTQQQKSWMKRPTEFSLPASKTESGIDEWFRDTYIDITSQLQAVYSRLYSLAC